MKRLILAAILAVASFAHAQFVYPRIDTNNTFTGNNTFSGLVNIGPGATGFDFSCLTGALSGSGGVCFYFGALGNSANSNSQKLQMQSQDNANAQIIQQVQQDQFGTWIFVCVVNCQTSAGSGTDVLQAAGFVVATNSIQNFGCHHGLVGGGVAPFPCFITDRASASGAGPNVNSQSYAYLSNNSGGTEVQGDHYMDPEQVIVFESGNSGGGPGVTRTTAATFAALTAQVTCNGSEVGAQAWITDALAGNCGDGTCNTWSTTVTGGGGALKRGISCNGTNWTIYAK